VKNELQDEVVSREEPEVCVVRWVLVFILAPTQSVSLIVLPSTGKYIICDARHFSHLLYLCNYVVNCVMYLIHGKSLNEKIVFCWAKSLQLQYFCSIHKSCGKNITKGYVKENPLSTLLWRTLYGNIGHISHQQFSFAQQWNEKHILFFLMIHGLH